ncbi:MAG TPA: zf-HC2 domain-containing protein [Candidatus Merdenecus merdavium]|nr:zf-HC2 domain-containing protein [Candidatus Merdenecus merdavium]
MECIVVEQMIMPYIKRELQDKDLEIFLKHIKTCKDCYEELEIYFTIHFGLLQLEKGSSAPMDITQMLKEHIKASERYLLNKKYKKMAITVIVALAQVALLFTLVTQIEVWSRGDLEETTLYRLHSGNYFQAVEHTSSEETFIIFDKEKEQRADDHTTDIIILEETNK